MRTLIHFIKYNNAFPVILVVALLLAGVALAANPEIRQAVGVGGTDEALGVQTPPPAPDASVLLNTDIEKFDFGFKINAVRQNQDTYYIDYFYRTLEIVGTAWTTLSRSKTLEVPKALLGNRDLGLYAADQIGQVMDREVAYLSEVQTKLRSNSQNTGGVKQYAGLVGKTLTGDGQLSSYHPVVKPDQAAAGPEITATNSADTLTVQLPGENQTVTTTLTKAEVREIIVEAIANFLAVDTPTPPVVSAPAPSLPEEDTPTAIPVVPSDPEGEAVAPATVPEAPVEESSTP